MATVRIKASDRTKACQQLVTVLKKQYGSKVPSQDHSVLDTLIFAVCLENSVYEPALQAVDTLKDSFFDYNEARVSSITELQQALATLDRPEWRAMRIRDSLQFVFEARYSYDLEDLKKKSLDAAEKYLKKIASLTPFAINYTLLKSVGAHLVPVDEQMTNAAIWLGLLEPQTELEQASDQLKSALRKADVPQFCYLFGCLASDPVYRPHFANPPEDLPEAPIDALKGASNRLKLLLSGKISGIQNTPGKTKTKSAAGKKTTKKTPKSTPTKKKSTAATGSKTQDKAAKKTATKKASAKKSTTKKKTAKKKTSAAAKRKSKSSK